MSSLVSIIIPVYNSAVYLKECLNSIKKQSYKNFEAIIINDGSTDNSEGIIKEFIANDNRFNLFSQENNGLGYTRNRGVSLSTGQYIFFLDSDDVIPSKAIEQLVSAIEKNDADYAVGKVIRFNEEKKYTPGRHTQFNLYKQNMLTDIHKNPELLQDSIACNKLWKKKFLTLNNLLFSEGKFYEDLIFTLKATVLAKKIEVISHVVYHWRVREDELNPSITQEQMKLKNTLDRLTALTLNKSWLTEQLIEPAIIKQNDLKSLLDVLGLHVVKYSLVSKNEKAEWVENITSFIKDIPNEIANMLPEKERNMYDMLMQNDLDDLFIYSQIFTNTETSPVVTRENNRFAFNGMNKTYDITNLLKPSLMVTKVENLGTKWKISGTLNMPKASLNRKGKFYVTKRNDSSIINLNSFELKCVDKTSVYPYEKQSFSFVVHPKIFKSVIENDILDFYYGFEDNSVAQSPRIRAHLSLVRTDELIYKNKSYSLYHTEFGNLSVKVLTAKSTNSSSFSLKEFLSGILKK